MQVTATTKYLRVQPRKVRIVADEIRGEYATKAAALLRFHPSKSAKMLRKVLVSAVANAVNNNGLPLEGLKIITIEVNEGPSMKRMQARAMGRGNRILKKTSHITVVVEDGEPPQAVKPHGTKAKPRPTLAKPVKKGAKKAEAVEAKVEEVVAEEAVVETPIEDVAEVVEAPAETSETPEGESTEEKQA
jgi:large subunit ribosomal protein L22